MDVLAALTVSEEFRGIVASETGTTKILNNVSRKKLLIYRISLILACYDYKHISANCDKYRWFKPFQSLILQYAV
ncbi:hypothetical protein FEM48_Zijuj01G0216800 [Ziziphus jujuba var. spinosa]|uniref:Uncharacterized protein n=1 Tax=Ziziphus jujuba var. spinosa TaxID=714518 RepID=A0A978W3Q2_ZIZJJ|nr:hypothetical protein FEM48_Zijuj01G0216800 [Ziziphus jujuba var. spinosa]